MCSRAAWQAGTRICCDTAELLSNLQMLPCFAVCKWWCLREGTVV